MACGYLLHAQERKAKEASLLPSGEALASAVRCGQRCLVGRCALLAPPPGVARSYPSRAAP